MASRLRAKERSKLICNLIDPNPTFPTWALMVSRRDSRLFLSSASTYQHQENLSLRPDIWHDMLWSRAEIPGGNLDLGSNVVCTSQWFVKSCKIPQTVSVWKSGDDDNHSSPVCSRRSQLAQKTISGRGRWDSALLMAEPKSLWTWAKVYMDGAIVCTVAKSTPSAIAYVKRLWNYQQTCSHS